MAGETALARQLKKLAVPQTTVLIQDKIRKSLLFDHRDASGLDREVVFAFGTCGLQKLCTLNSLFSKFETDLFSLSYKDFQRSVQSTSVNEKLDAKISEFLRMLSPYFLTRDAHEALEWLIYRFHIHLYNTDDLIASVLPHHTTSIFVRVVQLLDLNEKSRWFWLKPIQTTGVHLEYSAILNRFLTDGGFRKFVCNIAPNALAVYTGHENVAVPVISFSMLTIYNALEKCQVIKDKLINSLFPYILKGLNSDSVKYTSASYMIISKILSRIQLSPKVIEELLVKIFQTLKDDLAFEACEILALAFQTQMIKTLPPKVFLHFLSNIHSATTLFALLSDVKPFSLIRAFVKKSLATLSLSSKVSKCDKVQDFLVQFLKCISLDKKSASMCFKITAAKIIKFSRVKKTKKSLNPLKKMAKYIFVFLEQKYPDCFDEAYKKFLEKNSNNTSVCKLINKSVCSTKYEVGPNMKTSLVLGLYHANAQIRQTSVNYLLHVVATKKVSDVQFVKNSLVDRLFDDDPNVVLQILSQFDVSLHLLDKANIISAFEKILSRPIKLESKWYAVQMKCLKIIITLYGDNGNEFNVIKLILNFLFPVNKHTLEGFLELLNSDLNNLIKQLKISYENIDMSDNNNEKFLQINCMIVFCVKKNISEMDEEAKLKYAQSLNLQVACSKTNSMLVFYIYVMLFILETTENTNNYLLLLNDFLQVLNSLLSQFKTAVEKFETLYEDCIVKECSNFLNNKNFASHLTLYAFHKLIINPNLSIHSTSWPHTNGNYGDSHKILSNMFNFCILHLYSSKTILREYFQKMLSQLISNQFKSTEESFWFISTKLLDSAESSEVQFNAINVAIVLCKKQNNMLWFFKNPMLFFSVIKAVASPIPKLSHLALLLLSSCLESATDEIHPFKCLGDEIIKKSEEIKIDYKQSFSCVGDWVQPAVNYKDTKKPPRIGKELQSKLTVFDEILNLLSKDTVPYSLKHFLFRCLQNNDSPTILSSYIPILLNYVNALEKSSSDCESILNIISLLIKKFTPKTIACFKEDTKELKALLYCLNFNFNRNNEEDRSVQSFTLDVLNKDLFSAVVSDEVKLQILENLLVLYATSPRTINSKVEQVLRELCPYAYLYIKHHEEKMNISKSTTLREVKKLKRTENDTPDKSENNMWKNATILLELMQGESNLLQKEKVISGLFFLLEKSINCENEPSVEYVKQLILSAIHNCYEQLSLDPQKKINYEDFQIDKIIFCIRMSSNSKTHQQALLLLNLAATIFPEHILDKIMSVFVFMGSDLVRQDDSYSFQVLLQVIETILPSLLEASNQQTNAGKYQIVTPVIRNFVNSLLHIPEHRRLPLFSKIVTILDSSKYLWIPLGQICDKYADAFSDNPDYENKDWNMSNNSESWKALEFAINLHQQFPPDIQIDTCTNLLKFLIKLPDTKKQLKGNADMFKELFDLDAHSGNIEKQLQIFKQNILFYLKVWLSSEVFHSQIAELTIKQESNLEVKYNVLLKCALDFLQDRLNVNSVKEEVVINRQIKLLYDLIHAINSVLPNKLFLQVMMQLLENNEKELQLKAIELLNSKLELEGEELCIKNYNILLKLMESLMKMANVYLNKEDEEIDILQATIYSLHLLCKLLGKEDLKSGFSKKIQRKCNRRFFKVLEISIAILSHYEKPELIVNALLCVAQLCQCLNVDILRCLNSFMPIIINVLQDKKLSSMNDCLVLGILAALNSIVENLGAFLSSYMEDIVVNICLCSVKYFELGKKNIADSFENLQIKLAKEIPVRIFINIILGSYSKLSRKNVSSVIPLMKILTQNLESSKYDDILASAAELQNIYISLIDFRNSNSSISIKTLNLVENSIVSSLQSFVMKLSVTRFRTFFQKLYQWTVISDDDQVQKCRIFTFYKITAEFSKTLKSLFSVMSKYFFAHVSSILELCNFSKSKNYYYDSSPELSHELLINMLDTLNYCFMYSEEQLLDKENFELLMHPIIGHLENLHDEKMYQELVDQHLKSCIAHLMVAVSDSALWKSLNYQILLKTRHDSPKVRFGALQVILEVVNKMGDNYLTLLPESIPFLAEIMEDESSEVEQECQTVIVEMEKTLGEPIRDYF